MAEEEAAAAAENGMIVVVYIVCVGGDCDCLSNSDAAQTLCVGGRVCL